MSKKKLMTIVGIVMMLCGVGIGVFGIAMKQTWSSQAQTPKIYDWNNEDIGQSPSVDSEDDITVDKTTSSDSTDNDEKTDKKKSDDSTESNTSEADVTDNTENTAEEGTDGE